MRNASQKFRNEVHFVNEMRYNLRSKLRGFKENINNHKEHNRKHLLITQIKEEKSHQKVVHRIQISKIRLNIHHPSTNSMISGRFITAGSRARIDRFHKKRNRRTHPKTWRNVGIVGKNAGNPSLP